MVARVVMKGGTRPQAIRAPFSRPTPAATRMPASMPTTSPAGRATRSAAQPARAMVEPTDRSIPPVMITIVMPAATMALMETWRATLIRLEAVRNRSDSRLNTAPIRRRPRRDP